ncbi:MAG TPA: thiol:disulfide interchange protein, partial [Flavobacteriales bacterium]|nr:thiol:disulfide interchange protein [Flavobacteriales bacterium]
MKRIILFSSAILMFAFSATKIDPSSVDGNKRKVPAVKVKTLDGGTFNMADVANGGKPIVISFWATWCSPCKKELENMAEVYEDWQKETGVKIIAISIDDARNASK